MTEEEEEIKHVQRPVTFHKIYILDEAVKEYEANKGD